MYGVLVLRQRSPRVYTCEINIIYWVPKMVNQSHYGTLRVNTVLSRSGNGRSGTEQQKYYSRYYRYWASEILSAVLNHTSWRESYLRFKIDHSSPLKVYNVIGWSTSNNGIDLMNFREKYLFSPKKCDRHNTVGFYRSCTNREIRLISGIENTTLQ